jgi:hypothetical protein
MMASEIMTGESALLILHFNVYTEQRLREIIGLNMHENLTKTKKTKIRGRIDSSAVDCRLGFSEVRT